MVRNQTLGAIPLLVGSRDGGVSAAEAVHRGLAGERALHGPYAPAALLECKYLAILEHQLSG